MTPSQQKDALDLIQRQSLLINDLLAFLFKELSSARAEKILLEKNNV